MRASNVLMCRSSNWICSAQPSASNSGQCGCWAACVRLVLVAARPDGSGPASFAQKLTHPFKGLLRRVCRVKPVGVPVGIFSDQACIIAVVFAVMFGTHFIGNGRLLHRKVPAGAAEGNQQTFAIDPGVFGANNRIFRAAPL